MRLFTQENPMESNWVFSLFVIIYTITLIIAFALQIQPFINQSPTNIEDIETKEYKVMHNDTLWSIAIKHKPPNIDTREFIYYIKHLNTTNGMIYPGEILRLPRLREGD